MEKTNEMVRMAEAGDSKTDRLVDFYGERLTSEDALKARKIERRLKWKLDLTVLPLLSTVYFLAQMVGAVDFYAPHMVNTDANEGRADLGNAKVAGMQDDLSLTPHLYSNFASIFLVGYLVFRLPGV